MSSKPAILSAIEMTEGTAKDGKSAKDGSLSCKESWNDGEKQKRENRKLKFEAQNPERRLADGISAFPLSNSPLSALALPPPPRGHPALRLSHLRATY